MTKEQEALGRAAFEGYMAEVSKIDHHWQTKTIRIQTDVPQPRWEDLNVEYREAWSKAAWAAAEKLPLATLKVLVESR